MLRFQTSLDSTENSRSTELSSTGKKPQNFTQTSETPSPLGEGVTLCPTCNGAGYEIIGHNEAARCCQCNGDGTAR